MNPIASCDAAHFRLQIGKSEQKLHIYAVLQKTCRVALPLLGFSFLLAFGLLNPSYLPISSTLLFFAYAPCIDVTIGTIEQWEAAVKKQLDLQKAILEGLDEGKMIYEAWIAAIPDLELPCRPPQANQSAAPEGRQALYDYQLKIACIKLQNARRKLERTYLEHIKNNQKDQRSLEEFGTFQTWHLELLTLEGPFDVFVAAGKTYTNTDDYSEIFTPNDTRTG